MDLQLTRQHALITGGSKGIGLACAQGFLREGCRVSLVSRSQAHLELALQQLVREFPGAKAWRCRRAGQLRRSRAPHAA